MLESRSFCLKIHNLDLMSNNNGLFLFAQCDLLSIFSLMNQELFFMYKTFVLLGMNRCGLGLIYQFHMDIPLMYLGLYLNVSVLTLRQPKLRYLGYSCLPPRVGNFTSICQVFKWSFYLHEIIKNALYVYT